MRDQLQSRVEVILEVRSVMFGRRPLSDFINGISSSSKVKGKETIISCSESDSVQTSTTRETDSQESCCLTAISEVLNLTAIGTEEMNRGHDSDVIILSEDLKKPFTSRGVSSSSIPISTSSSSAAETNQLWLKMRRRKLDQLSIEELSALSEKTDSLLQYIPNQNINRSQSEKNVIHDSIGNNHMQNLPQERSSPFPERYNEYHNNRPNVILSPERAERVTVNGLSVKTLGMKNLGISGNSEIKNESKISDFQCYLSQSEPLVECLD